MSDLDVAVLLTSDTIAAPVELLAELVDVPTVTDEEAEREASP